MYVDVEWVPDHDSSFHYIILVNKYEKNYIYVQYISEATILECFF
jgi:hypothetical protein